MLKEGVENFMGWIITLLKIIFGTLAVFIVSQIVSFLLDRWLKKFRIDKWIIFLLFIKNPLASTKITVFSKTRLDLKSLKKKLESVNKEGFDKNEIVNGKYLFRYKNHPTPIMIKIVEPEENGEFTIIIETYGKDKLSKFGLGSIKKTIQIIEQVTNFIDKSKINNITVSLDMSYIIEEKIILNFEDSQASYSTNSVKFSTNKYSEVTSLIKKCLNTWKINFL